MALVGLGFRVDLQREPVGRVVGRLASQICLRLGLGRACREIFLYMCVVVIIRWGGGRVGESVLQKAAEEEEEEETAAFMRGRSTGAEGH